MGESKKLVKKVLLFGYPAFIEGGEGFKNVWLHFAQEKESKKKTVDANVEFDGLGGVFIVRKSWLRRSWIFLMAKLVSSIRSRKGWLFGMFRGKIWSNLLAVPVCRNLLCDMEEEILYME